MAMNAPAALITAVLIALALGLVLCRLVMLLGVKDAPDEARKIQKTAVPTSGGIGFAAATLIAAFIVSGFVSWRVGGGLMAAAAGALPYLVMGYVDDRLKLDSITKLGVMLGGALLMVWGGVSAEAMVVAPGYGWPLPPMVGGFGSLLWIIILVNAVNFMDGANGLSMGMALIAAIGFAVLAAFTGAWDVATLSAALAGALGGFLVWNVSGKLFAGDAGALFVGAQLAGLSLLIVRARPDWVLAPPTIMAPFLTDVVLTLMWRARHGKSLFVAHRDHTYQIAMKAGLKHWQVSLIHAVWALNAAALGVMAAIAGGYAPLAVFVALMAVSIWIHLRIRKMGVRSGLVGPNIA
jgi:UDP-N-acetylmuramyl pentapeptide phosphotransferase/UDP-N-acetylglucosamine-1-phosphate transferase